MRTTLAPRAVVKRCWPSFVVSDLAETAAFCRDRLGFEVAYEEPDHDLAIYCRGEVFIMFREMAGASRFTSTESGRRAAFEHTARCGATIHVEHILSLHEELRDRGADPTPLQRVPYGRQTTVTLPDGYVLAFLQMKTA